MKKALIILSMSVLLPLAAQAQNSNWERPADYNEQPTSEEDAKQKEKEEKKKAKELARQEAEAKYGRGAAPIIDDYVQWNLDLDLPGKKADEIYNAVYDYLQKLTKEENQVIGSQIALVNKEEHGIVATIKEWIIFRKAFLSLDRVKATYAISVKTQDEKLHVNISRIVLNYTENVKDGIYTAEEWISDEKALKKNGKMYPGCAKFRRKMIDRKDTIFEQIKALF